MFILKGYYFNRSDKWHFIIGSSNWTSNALSINTELNILISENDNSHITLDLINEFNHQWNKAVLLNSNFIEKYSVQYSRAKRLYGQSSLNQIIPDELNPNKMQIDALVSLEKIRKTGSKKSLIISATGTGKTFLSAFDAKAFNSKKLLFVVHRENIAKKSKKSFEMIFGNTRTYGMYTGNEKQCESDFIFSTVQTLSRPQNLKVFDKEHFDYIIVDESHRASANTYESFLSYFKPVFLLGMTATPERTDGVDIFEKFDHNVAYEIRLQQALEEDILCPFHYFGVADITLEGKLLEEVADFNNLTTNERVDRIIEKSKFFGCYDNKIRSLVFCSKVDEAIKLSECFNIKGYKAIALTGKSSEEEREQAIIKLETDDTSKKIDYIFTFDIFNEGVDIPKVNQIIMLRPTQSAIVFVQQLGRGLRKVDGEDKYLTVIDFIGNYQNNYLIPVALYGDNSYDKDRMRRLMVGENEGVPGTSTVSFDRVAKERIFNSINTANTQQLNLLKQDYFLLKQQIGRIPLMMDFWTRGARDPKAFIDKKKSHYNFIQYCEGFMEPELNSEELKIIEYYSRYVLDSSRSEEAVILGQLIKHKKQTIDELLRVYERKIGVGTELEHINSAINCLNLEFLRPASKEDVNYIAMLKGSLITLENNKLGMAGKLLDYLKNPHFKKYILDLIKYSKSKFKYDLNSDQIVGGFVRYRKYSRSNVLRILGWRKDQPPLNIGGYVISESKTKCPIFVTYHKDDEISESIKYEDRFMNKSQMEWYTKSRRTFESSDVRFFRKASKSHFIPLFVNKDNDEGKEFYFMGSVNPAPETFTEKMMPSDDPNMSIPVVTMVLNLDCPVEDGLYDYLHEKNVD